MAGVSVEKLVQLSDQIADQAAENQQLWDEAIAHSEKTQQQYEAGQRKLRVMVAEFNVLAQQVADGTQGTSTVRPVSGGSEAASPGGTDRPDPAAAAGG